MQMLSAMLLKQIEDQVGIEIHSGKEPYCSPYIRIHWDIRVIKLDRGVSLPD